MAAAIPEFVDGLDRIGLPLCVDCVEKVGCRQRAAVASAKGLRGNAPHAGLSSDIGMTLAGFVTKTGPARSMLRFPDRLTPQRSLLASRPWPAPGRCAGYGGIPGGVGG